MKRMVVATLVTVLCLCGCANNIKDGTAFLEAGKYEEAKDAFQNDIEKERNLKEAYRGYGIALFELGEYEEAAIALKTALQNEAEETATILGLIGASYMQLEEYDQALEIYQKALAKEDLSQALEQEIRFNLIALYEFTGNWDAAKTQMEEYVKDYPDDARVDKEAEFLESR